MTRYKKYGLMALVLAGGMFASCSDDFAEPPMAMPESGIGTGAWDSPFTSTQARLGSINYQINPAWVKGYIVGVIDTEKSTVLNANSGDFLPPFTVETNMLMADDPEPFKRLIELEAEGDEKAYETLRDSLLEVVATVQLPSNMRDQLGLVSNPNALHEAVCVQGITGQTYCGEYGVRSLVAFNWGEEGTAPKPVEDGETVGKFYQNFTAATTIGALETAGWRNEPAEGNLSGWQVVVTDNNNYIATDAALGFANGGPYEHWLVTPAIDLESLPEKTLEFESSAANPADGCSIEVWAMTKSDPSDPACQASKLDATFAVPAERGYSAWISSGKISLAAFSGEIYIGWCYKAVKGGYGNSVTYCLDNINVGNCPEPADWTKAQEFYTSLGMNDENGAEGWTFDNVLLSGGISRVWQWKAYNGAYYLNASAYYQSKNNPSLSYAYSQPVDLTEYKNVGLSFDHAASFQTTITKLGRVVVREAGATDWTEFVIPAWPVSGKWVFSTSGIIDISDFAGKTVEIGFKYESNENGADTWEIRSLSLIGIK